MRFFSIEGTESDDVLPTVDVQARAGHVDLAETRDERPKHAPSDPVMSRQRSGSTSAAVGVATVGAAVSVGSGPAVDPGSVSDADATAIFGADEARAFQDRWRDVQLSFVDSPREATVEAAALLNEVIEKLAASLRVRRETLAEGDSYDTEKLRIELRGYRDVLNRVIGL